MAAKFPQSTRVFETISLQARLKSLAKGNPPMSAGGGGFEYSHCHDAPLANRHCAAWAGPGGFKSGRNVTPAFRR